jgi:hypothetical protein
VSQASGSNPFGIDLAEARTRKQFTAANWASAGSSRGKNPRTVRWRPARAGGSPASVRASSDLSTDRSDKAGRTPEGQGENAWRLLVEDDTASDDDCDDIPTVCHTARATRAHSQWRIDARPQVHRGSSDRYQHP